MPPLTDGSGAEGAHRAEQPSGPEAASAAPPGPRSAAPEEVELAAGEHEPVEQAAGEPGDDEPTDAGPADAGPADVGPADVGPAADADPTGESPAGAESEVRRHPSTIGGAFYLLILAATVVGLVIVALGRWRTGVHWMGGALVVAAAVRALLPSRDAGMLAVRQRWFDAVLLAGAGVALWALATSIPDA